MMNTKPERSAAVLRARRTNGDFPHARRASTELACCSCTTCCLFLLGGAVGGLAGFITGIVKGVGVYRRGAQDPRGASKALAIVMAVGTAVGLAVVGLVVGVFVGGCLDYVFGTLR